MEFIPFFTPAMQHEQIRKSLDAAVREVIDSGTFVLGQQVERFERAYANYTGTPYCIGVGNGTDALTLCLSSCDLGPEDEVIVPAHTYFATWLAVSRSGARIVPVDAEESTFNMDTAQIPDAITARTRIILPVHLYGQPCNMTAIDEIARAHSVIVIEDNAQAHGGRWLEKISGSFGTVSATSFYPTKNLGAMGDGGAVTGYDPHKVASIRQQRNYGMSEKNIFPVKGLNSRLDELQAAVLSVKLTHLEEWNDARRRIARRYLAALSETGDLTLPLSAKEAHHVYHLFVLRTAHRDRLQSYLLEHGIGTAIHYPVPPHRQEAYAAGFRQGQFPVAERIAESALSLPVWPGLREDQVEYICGKISDFFNRAYL